MRWIALLAMLVWAVSARAEPPGSEREAPPVGGLFGLFGRSHPKAKPTAVEPEAPEVSATEVPAIAPTATPLVAPTVSPPARAATIAPEPTATSPAPSPTPTVARRQRKGAKAEPTVTPTPSEAPEEGAEEEGAVEATPEAEPTPAEGEEGAEREIRPEAGSTPGEAEAEGVPEKREASRGPSGKSDVQLPSVEIQGELEKPDIFFVLPRARDQSDEQLMRSRIRREITRPVIKDWIEEEMLLK